MNRRKFYEAKAQQLVREMRESKQVTYEELARRLNVGGGAVSDVILRKRFSRGSFSLSFSLMVLDALGVESIDVPHYTSDASLKKPAQAKK